MKAIYIVCMIALLCAMMVTPAAATETFYPDRDTYLEQQYPDTNYYDSSALAVRSKATDLNKRTIIHFDISKIPSGATIDSAKLHLYLYQAGVVPIMDRTHNLHILTENWTETGATWNSWSTPGGVYDPTVTSSTSTGTNVGVWREWDVKSSVQAFVSGTPNYGWLIKDAVEDESTTSRFFNYYSDECSGVTDPTNRPYLEVTYTEAAPTQPDLIVSEVDAYHYEGAKTGFAWFNLSNYIDVTVKNNGTADAGAFNISLYADGEFIGEQRIANLSAGSNETLVFEWKPIGLDEQDGGSPHTYSMLAKADPYNAVSESDEFNNNMTVSETVKYNGYMADEPLNTFSHGTLRGGLLFTTGDANYIGVTYPGLIGSVHYNVDIPQTSSVMLARLNIYYTWAKYWSPYPVLRVEITNQTGTYNVSLKAAYHDRAGSFSGWNLPWGNYVYDLSDYIKQNGSYTVTIYNNGTGYQSLAIASPGLIVLYSDESMPLIEYWLAEGADVLMGGRRSDSGSYLTLEECINNATFEGSIELSRVKNAALGIVSPWGSWGWFPGSGNVLYINDVEIGRSPNVYLNGWNAIGDISLGGIRMTGTGAGQVGVNLSNVTDYLNTNINTAGQGDDGDNMMPSNAFLLVEVAEVPDFSISVSPSSASIIRGGSTNATVTLTSILGYDKNVTLGASGMPLNTTISFTPEKGKPDYTSTMLVSTKNTTPAGTYPITINGTGDDGKVHSTIFTLKVTTAAGGANASVSLKTNIIAAIAIEVTPSYINFGELSPGETSSGNNLTVKNKGGYSIDVSAEVTDSAENLFVNGALLNDKLWSLYSAVIPKNGDDKPVAKLHVPDDYAGVGGMEGTMMFWAKKA